MVTADTKRANPGSVGEAKLLLSVRLAFSVGHVLNDLCAAMWFTYLLVFLHLVLNFSNTFAGVILLVGQCADGIATLFVGYKVGSSTSRFKEAEEDQKSSGFCRRLSRLGPRKSWHLFGTFCVVVSFPFIFLPCLACESSSHWAHVIYYSTFAVIFQFGWAAVQISHLSLIPVLAKDEHTRTELTALRYAFAVVSNIAIHVVTWVTLGVAGASHRVVGPQDASKFRDVALMAVGLGGLLSLLFHWGVSESHSEPSIDERRRQLSGPAPMKALDWLKERQFYQVAVLYVTTCFFVNLAQVFLPLWLQDSLVLGGTTVATSSLSFYISGFLTSLFMKRLTRITGRKVVYIIGAVIGFSGSVLVCCGSGELFRSYGVYAVAALFGAGASTMLITSLSITADLIGTNVDSGAFVYGAMSLAEKVCNGVAIVLIQHYHTTKFCPDCFPYYGYVLTLACGGAAILSLLTLATLYATDIGFKLKRHQSPNSVPCNAKDNPNDDTVRCSVQCEAETALTS